MAKQEEKKSKEGEMTFLGHLEELRWHIVRSASVAFVLMIIAFVNRDFIFNDVILKPKSPDFPTNQFFARMSTWLSEVLNMNMDVLRINTSPLNIVNIEMAGQFMSHIKVSLIAGLVVASPYVIWEVWRFIKPALHRNEVKHATGAVFYSSILFILGILFGYYIITPLSIHFLSSYNVSQEIANTIKLNSYIATVTSVTFASGVIFELPILVLFLSKIGLLSPTFMRKYRRHAYVVLLIISAIITPPDVFSQILVCIPLIILYEISVFVSRSVHRKREQMENEDARKSGRNVNKTIKDEVPFDRSYIDGSEEKP
jgi:sec-independent protein translocase protein TatC